MHAGSFADQLALAVEAAHAAGELLRAAFGNVQRIRHKGEIDLVTEMDEAAERAVVEMIRRRFPNDSILAEEGTIGGDDPHRLWIVDPLDGTTNFAHGYPCFDVSIALEIDGSVQLGVVYQPILDELFTAISGQGAFLNGAPIHVSTTDRLLQSLLVSGFPYDRAQLHRALEYWERVLPVAQAIRRDGAAAIDLCYVAMGRFDGFWERDLKPWDQAAGSLIVAEAGGTLSSYRGGPFAIRDVEVVATNGRIHAELLAALAEA
ncbi:MAG: monophosphatase [Chloroflexota bacterium]|jgi:myo-inositol-1(or 4)-monophosphatase|nr:monophosphatase [Chloroflexota bacterium]